MADRSRTLSIEELPAHLILEILSSGRLSSADLACLEATCRIFRQNHEACPDKFCPLIERASFHLCENHLIFASLPQRAKREIVDRCGGNWKKVLRFLQLVEQSSGTVKTSAGNMQVTTGRYHMLLIHDSSVYSCGSSLCGVLGHGQDTAKCVVFNRINIPSSLSFLLPEKVKRRCREVTLSNSAEIPIWRTESDRCSGDNIRGRERSRLGR